MNIKRLRILITIIGIILLAWGIYLWVTAFSWSKGMFEHCAALHICDIAWQNLQSRNMVMFSSLGIGIVLIVLSWLMGGTKHNQEKES